MNSSFIFKKAQEKAISIMTREDLVYEIEDRICIKCNKKLNSKTRPTTYSISKYPRLGAPKHLYLCAKCANDEAPTLKTLLEDYLSAIQND